MTVALRALAADYRDAIVWTVAGYDRGYGFYEARLSRTQLCLSGSPCWPGAPVGCGQVRFSLAAPTVRRLS